uniref:Glycoside hydrolase family 5 domain-containing protein n=1 Tax=Acrobeloides nanus TaxID=290746 RepID=A0A914D8P6_9BILA
MFLIPVLLLAIFNCGVFGRARWTEDQAKAWFNSQPYIMGTEYMASYAVNQLEMFQAETFNPDLIDKELALYGQLGMNTIRVFMIDLAYNIDPTGFKNRVNTLVEISAKYGIKPTLLFFTPSVIKNPTPGKQPKPDPGLVSSRWAETPSRDTLLNPSTWPQLETYVKDVVGTFANDSRVLMWDIWNEPDSPWFLNATEMQFLNQAIPLAFEWARSMNPIQPLTSSIFHGLDGVTPMIQINNSDVVSFHK